MKANPLDRSARGQLDYRTTVGAIQCRSTSARAGAAATSGLAGYAAVFNVETVIAGMFREKILRGAFVDSIANDDVPAQFNHDPNYVLGRTANKTVRLAEDRTGLRYEVDLNDRDPEAVRIGAIVARGDVRGSSFAFCCEQEADEEWIVDDPAKLPLRIVKRARLYDVAPVTTPAYPTTTVSANAAQRAAAARGIPLEILERELELLALEAGLGTESATPSRSARRRQYSDGIAGLLERELELSELEI